MMKRLESKLLLVFSYLLIAGVALLRLEHINVYNVIPVFSCLLLFAATRPAREYCIPLFALVGVDVFLTTHQYSYTLTIGSAVTWVGYLIVMLLGRGFLRGGLSARLAVTFSLLASISFFLASNFVVWAEWGMYPKIWSGLGTCYVAALPFFRNSIASEVVFSLLIFSFARNCEAYVPVLRMRRVCS
jgi:hypothetical protein